MLIAILSLLFLFGIGFFVHSVARGPLEATLGATLMVAPFLIMLTAIADEVEKIKKLMKKERAEEK